MSEVKTLSANALRERLAARKTGGAAAVGTKKAVKTAAQLEEEEARARALDMEIEEMERREKERWDRFYRMFRPPDVRGYLRRRFADKLKIALHRIQDKNGKIYETLDEMLVKKKKEKWMYVRFWHDLDDKHNNRVPYDRFCKYFRLTADPWSKRLFDLINVSLSGTLSFYDFLKFCQTHLIVDRETTEEYAFKMFSRRGQTVSKFSVLDMEDMRLFLKYRFKINNPKELSKIALDVFEYVDADGDGGLFLDEWQEFNTKNLVFVRYFHCYLTHLRKCIFGIKYWVEKTRVIKAKNAKGLIDNLSLTSRINIKDEKWTLVELKDGVIDARNRPVITEPWVEVKEKKEDVTKDLDRREKDEAEDLAQDILEDKDNPDDPVFKERAEDEVGLTEEQKKQRRDEEEKKKKDAETAANAKKSRKDKKKEEEERQKKRKQEKEAAGKKAQDEGNPTGLKAGQPATASAAGGGGGGSGSGNKGQKDEQEGGDDTVRKRNFILVGGKLQEQKGDELVTGEYVDKRTEVAWRGPFQFTAAAKRKFEEDFVEVHVKRMQRQFLKDLKKKEAKDLSKKVAGRTYKKLVKVCEDLIYARRWLRMGFNRWADSVGLETSEMRNGEKRSEAELIKGRREAGKKQMAKLMSATVKKQGLLGGKKLTKEEQAEMARLEEEQKILAEAEAKAKAEADKKLAEEEHEYMLHSTILKNCKKQEDEVHDEDNVFSGYVMAEKQRLNLPLVKGLAHRHTHVTDSYDLFLLGDPDIGGLGCLAEMAAREELKSRASTTFSSKPNTRGQSRGRSRGQSRGGGSSSPTRGGRSGSPSRGGGGRSTQGGGGQARMQSRADSSHARRKAAELPPPGTKLPGLTGGLRALLPKSTILSHDDLRFGLSSAGRREKIHLEELGLPAFQRSVSPPGESKWSVEVDDDLEDVDPDAYFISKIDFEPIWYPTFNDPEAPTENRKSNPERSYIFESDKRAKPESAESEDSDSSADL